MQSTKKLVTYAMISAMAYVVMLFIRIPIMGSAAPFLKYDPKDVIIVIGGFLYGPLAAAAIAVVVAFVEMVTVSDSGPIGMVMNILSSVAFAGTAAAVYKYKRSMIGAVIGLAAGCLTTTCVMLLWNYIVTPVYMGVPRPVVVGMLLPVFLPFNLIKTIINGAAVVLIYKPVVTALRKAGLLGSAGENAQIKPLSLEKIIALGFMIVSILIIVFIFQGGNA